MIFRQEAGEGEGSVCNLVDIYCSATNRFLHLLIFGQVVTSQVVKQSLLPAGPGLRNCWLQGLPLLASQCQGERFSEKTWIKNIYKWPRRPWMCRAPILISLTWDEPSVLPDQERVVDTNLFILSYPILWTCMLRIVITNLLNVSWGYNILSWADHE